MRYSHGNGDNWPIYPKSTVIENSVKIFNRNNVKIFRDVYIGHNTILKGRYPYGWHPKSLLTIGPGCWIGENCYLNGAGGIDIQSTLKMPVGIGPGVYILTSEHRIQPFKAIMNNELLFAEVILEKGCDVGSGSIILPGVRVGEGALIGAGSVITKDVLPYSVTYGNPARFIRTRKL